MNIKAIAGILLNLALSWKPTDNIENDIADGILVLAGYNQLAPGNAMANAVFKAIGTDATSLANLNNGQAALVGTVGGVEHNGAPDKIVVVAMYESSAVAKQVLGL